MKRTLLLMLSLLVISGYAKDDEVPSWVTNRPISTTHYIGIGRASVTDDDYQNKAMHNALSEIASQIYVNVEGSSFMRTVDVDGHSKELFEEKVTESVAAMLEGQKLVATYQSPTTYFVYYELDRNAYEAKKEAYRKQGITAGLDYYVKGKAAETANNYSGAIELYAKGLEAIENYLNLDLTTTYEGSSFNVASELYNAYLNVFSNMVVTTNTKEVGGELFKPVGDVIACCLSKNNVVVPNVKMKLEFVTGSGDVTKPVATDYNGTSEFYITNITSKMPVQELVIGVDDSFIQMLPRAYQEIIKKQTLPSAKITLVLISENITAYLSIDNNDLEGCVKQVQSILTNNYFVLTESTDAKIFISLSTEFSVGNVVAGELYDMNECFSSLTLKIFDNAAQQELLNYTTSQVRTLVPVSKSEIQTKAACARELMKKVNKELPKVIKQLNIQ